MVPEPVERAISRFGEVVVIELPLQWEGSVVPDTSIVRLKTHAQALAAVQACEALGAVALGLGDALVVKTLYNDTPCVHTANQMSERRCGSMPDGDGSSSRDADDSSGWCNFEQGAALIAAGIRDRGIFKQKGDKGEPQPPKLIDISAGRAEVVRVKRPPTARELEERIERAVFIGKGDKAVVIQQMRAYRHILESVGGRAEDFSAFSRNIGQGMMEQASLTSGMLIQNKQNRWGP
jgi:hypothetical protein